MKITRLIAAVAITAGGLVASVSTASADPKKCPPGQTAVIEVVGVEVVDDLGALVAEPAEVLEPSRS